MKCCENEEFELIKKYEPKPKNPDGSIRSFLYRWDDGKDGYRKLVKCKSCGTHFLVQCYKLTFIQIDARGNLKCIIWALATSILYEFNIFKSPISIYTNSCSMFSI